MFGTVFDMNYLFYFHFQNIIFLFLELFECKNGDPKA